MKDWRKMLEEVGGYENELAGVPAGGVREMVDEIESLRQQLAEALAAIKLKDSAMKAVLCDPEGAPCFAGSDGDRQVIADAIAIQPDDSALKEWLGEPVAWLHEKRQDSDVITDAVKNVWNGVVVGRMAQYSIPLYAQKRLTK